MFNLHLSIGNSHLKVIFVLLSLLLLLLLLLLFFFFLLLLLLLLLLLFFFFFFFFLFVYNFSNIFVLLGCCNMQPSSRCDASTVDNTAARNLV